MVAERLWECVRGRSCKACPWATIAAPTALAHPDTASLPPRSALRYPPLMQVIAIDPNRHIDRPTPTHRALAARAASSSSGGPVRHSRGLLLPGEKLFGFVADLCHGPYKSNAKQPVPQLRSARETTASTTIAVGPAAQRRGLLLTGEKLFGFVADLCHGPYRSNARTTSAPATRARETTSPLCSPLVAPQTPTAPVLHCPHGRPGLPRPGARAVVV